MQCNTRVVEVSVFAEVEKEESLLKEIQRRWDLGHSDERIARDVEGAHDYFFKMTDYSGEDPEAQF